jgi:branched-chain amino acid transport system substrate-binding protein
LCDATNRGRGSTADEFSKILKDNGIAVGLVERMDQGAQDMNAQLVKFKGSSADTLFVTTAVEQLSLVLKQAASQSTPNVYLVKIDNGKVTVPKI